jgi:alkylation response protein AidB-like acyl-CoA dehydrogenase
MANRFARECLEESITYARTRKTFGQRLIDHQVIRHKIAEMASRVEGCQLQLENIVSYAPLLLAPTPRPAHFPLSLHASVTDPSIHRRPMANVSF